MTRSLWLSHSFLFRSFGRGRRRGISLMGPAHPLLLSLFSLSLSLSYSFPRVLYVYPFRCFTLYTTSDLLRNQNQPTRWATPLSDSQSGLLIVSTIDAPLRIRDIDLTDPTKYTDTRKEIERVIRVWYRCWKSSKFNGLRGSIGLF